MKKLIVALYLLVAPLIHAQAPTIMIPPPPDGERLQPLRITRVEAEARIHGVLAETEMTLTFFNPNRRVLEGDLVMGLPEGSVISGYALDIDGVMVDGVIVDKDKGRVVFEQIERQGIDPGLVEHSQGHSFKTRIFPIPSRGTRIVRVKYVTELLDRTEGPVYFLPLNFPEPVKDFNLRISVIESALPPAADQPELGDLTFAQWHHGFLSEIHRENVILTKPLKVLIPATASPEIVVEKTGAEYFFALHDQQAAKNSPQLTTGSADGDTIVFWDASGSQANADHKAALAVIRAWMNMTASTVHLVLLRDRPILAGIFDDEHSLISTLNTLSYDGASGLNRLSEISLPPEVTRGILFSDGLNTFGPGIPPKLPVPLIVLSNGAGADFAWLKRLASDSGGRWFDLDQWESKKLVDEAQRPIYALTGIDVISGTVEHIHPQVGTPVNGRFDLYGQLISETATIRLHFGIVGIKGEHQFSRTFKLKRSTASDGQLLSRAWAQHQIDDLLIEGEGHIDQVKALGRRFSIVTPGTSLIVLENPDQYIEHDIEPPASMPEWRSKFYDAKKIQKKKVTDDRESKISRVHEAWSEKVAWWQTKFTYDDDFRYRDHSSKKRHSGGGAGRSAPSPDAIEAPAVEKAIQNAMEQSFAEEISISGLNSISYSVDQDDEENWISTGPSIQLNAADPDAPYLKKLNTAAEPMAAYYKERQTHQHTPAFFLDCGSWFLEHKGRDEALQILSNIAEMELENAGLLRVLAHKMAQIGELERARELFETVLKMRPEEPQSFRDLALVAAQLGDIERAIELLWEVIIGQWDSRFDEIELIALMELNDLVAKSHRAGLETMTIDPRLDTLLHSDIRILLSWDLDMTDMDLWVTEPSGEKCFYSHNRSTIGGFMSRDFTQGYGPEEYFVRRAMPGTYMIEANFFGSSSAKLTGAVTIQAEITTNFGRENEERQTITLRLKGREDVIKVGEIEF